MPSKLQTYMQMADEAQRQITGSYRGWTGFLTTAARLYKYPYAEQVMIHAQRPDATACAEYDFWNEKMGRYVRRGSKGIALIDSSGERPRLRYVFDVSDTGGREFPKSRYLWEYREEHADAVSAMLESRYGVDGKGGLPDQLERIASQLAEEYWRDYKRDILAIVDDSFLYGYDEFNVGAAFQSAAAVSIGTRQTEKQTARSGGGGSQKDKGAVPVSAQFMRRSIRISVRLTEEEHRLLKEKMARIGVTNQEAFLRKMALDGLVIRLDLPELKQMISLLRYTSNNINQIAKRLNESGRAYAIPEKKDIPSS